MVRAKAYSMKKPLNKGIICLLAIAIWLTNSSSIARSEQPDTLYQKNFAKEVPFTNQGNILPKRLDPIVGMSSGETAKVEAEFETLKQSTDVTENTLSEKDLEHYEGSIPVRKVGAIINGRDPKHLIESVNELLSTAEKKKVPVGKIYIVAFPSKVDPNDGFAQALGEAGSKGQLEFAVEMPKEYSAHLSPSWILTLDDMELVLDGMGPLSKQITDKGELAPSVVARAMKGSF